MKVLMIVPKYNLMNKPDFKYIFPLGLAYVSSAIKNAGYDLDCLNLNHKPGTIKEIIRDFLENKKYDYVCTGHMCIGFFIIKEIIEAVRSHESSPKIILGGPIITTESELMFRILKPDFAVLGEGEITIVDLLNSLKKHKNLSKVEGILLEDENKDLMITKKREVIMDLDSLSPPDFEGFEFEKRLNNSCTNDSQSNNLQDYPRPYPLLCSRSCPFQCTFCYHPLGRKYRKRSMDNIMDELEQAIIKYKINCISIYDDLFSVDRERLYDFCKRIKKLFEKTPWKITWDCQLSVNTVDEDMLKTLKEAGCTLVGYGFESMSLEVLKSMKKPITPEKIDKVFKLTMATGLGIQGNFIFGDIAETKETAYKTLNYYKKHCNGQINLDFIQPYPESEIYKHCLKKGIIKDKVKFLQNLGDRYFLNMTDNMTDKEINKLKKDILQATEKYRKSTTPISTKKISNNIYELTSKCPYCKGLTTYKKFRIENKTFFSNYMTCSNCRFRFEIHSPIKKAIKNLYPFLFPLFAFYVKNKRKFLEKKL